MSYHNFEVRDFLNDDRFVRWVLYAEEDAFWQTLLVSLPHKRHTIEEARQAIIDLNLATQPVLVEIDENRTWATIKEAISSPNETVPARVVHFWQQPYLRWAAVFIALLGIGWFLVQQPTEKPISYQELVAEAKTQTALVEKYNTSDTPLPIKLDDGSVITLGKNSRISYPVHFDARQREVFLSGEAFFSVAKNPAKPFLVYAGELVTKVLGTSFIINAYDKDKIVQVKVKTGRVSVFAQHRTPLAKDEADGLILTPNQQALFNRTSESLTKRLVDDPSPLKGAVDSGKRRFDEVPLPTILKELQTRYGVQIVYNEDLLANCFITTTLSKESLYDNLDILCEIVGASYKEVDAQLVIESKGCQ